MSLKEHRMDGIVILPRQLCRHGQDLVVCLGPGRLRRYALAAEKLVERHVQRVGQQRQKRDIGAAGAALPLGDGLIAHAEHVRQRFLCQPFFPAAGRNPRSHCQFFQLSILLHCVIIIKQTVQRNAPSSGNAPAGRSAPSARSKASCAVSLFFRQRLSRRAAVIKFIMVKDPSLPRAAAAAFESPVWPQYRGREEI